VGSTPSAIKIPSTSADSTAGIVGVCTGARYISSLGQLIFQQYLPANTITGGGSDVWIQVVDDPNTIFRVLGTAALGSFNSGSGGSGWPGAIGKNTTLDFNVAGSTSTGNSGVRLTVGSNCGTLATTSTFAMRIIDVVDGTTGDSYPEFYVKFNVGVHSYDNSLGV
jgi:hypothetical protein